MSQRSGKRKAPPGKPVWVKSHWRRKVRVSGHYRKKPKADIPF